MATQKEILREFLVQLGFDVDMSASRKFYDALAQSSKGVAMLAGGLATVAVAAEAMVNKFANNIEKLYYSSKRTKATVGELQAVEFAAEQIGLKGDQAVDAIESMARAFRLNPAVMAVLKGLGVQVTGRTTMQVFLDTIEKLGKMGFVGAGFAQELFGWTPDFLLQMYQNLDKFKDSMAKSIEMNKKAGTDIDRDAETWKDYANSVREVWERISRLALSIATELLPRFKELTAWINDQLIPAVQKMVHDENGFGALKTISGYVKDIYNGFAALSVLIEKETGRNPFELWARGIQVIVDSIKMVGTLSALIGHGEFAEAARVAKNFVFGTEVVEPSDKVTGAAPKGGSGGSTPSGTRGLFDRIERAFNLPPGTMDRLWKTESSRGANMGPSSTGAFGNFQFMPGTAQKYGVERGNLESEAIGAGQYLSDLIGKNGGDIRKALGAYGGWGTDLNHMNPKGQRYIDNVMGGSGVTLNATTNINVTGADAHSTASAVASAQGRVFADAVRNLQGAVR